MEKLLKLASAKADQAEVYYNESSSDNISFVDAKLETANTSLNSGIALRIIKDGKIGFAHTRNLLDPEALIKQALLSAENGTPASFQFPHTKKSTPLSGFDPQIEKLRKSDLIEEGKKLLSYIRSKTDAQCNFGIEYGIEQAGILNSSDTQLQLQRSAFVAFVQLIFAGTGSGVYQYLVNKSHEKLSQDKIDQMIELYNISKNQIVPPTKSMPVIFHHYSLSALLSRLKAALNPANIFGAISPLCNRLGEQILSTKFSMYQDPFAPDMSSSTSFDDEAVPTRQLTFFEDGVYKAYPTDLNYAQKLGVEPTGNGFRASVESQPSPGIINLCLKPGNSSLDEMISGIKEGIIVQSLMGAHSGNILNGDFSVGVSTGFLIQDGKLIGRLKDCMLSGNVYESLKNIAAIENTVHNMGDSKLPSVLIDGVSVAGK